MNDMLKTIFGEVIDSSVVFDGFKKLENTFFNTDGVLRPRYGFTDKGDKYDVTVKCDEERDKLHVKTDKDKRLLQVSVYEDFDKTNAISSCTYYGKFVMTVPNDCDMDSIEQKFNKEDKTVTISFKKITAETTCKCDGKECKCKNGTNDNTINYRDLYNDLCTKYTSDVAKFKTENANLRKENETLKSKINDIKKLF